VTAPVADGANAEDLSRCWEAPMRLRTR